MTIIEKISSVRNIILSCGLNAGVGVRACARVRPACCVSTSGECVKPMVCRQSCDRECSLFVTLKIIGSLLNAHDEDRHDARTAIPFFMGFRRYWRFKMISATANFNIIGIVYSVYHEMKFELRYSSFIFLHIEKNEIGPIISIGR